MNQRPGKTHSAILRDGDRISLRDLVNFCKSAKEDLEKEGDNDAAFRFEMLEDYLRTDYQGGKLEYKSSILGL